MTVTLYCGDVLDVLAAEPPESYTACFCDPPYGLAFMGKEWDSPQMLGQMATGHEKRGAFAYGGSHSQGYFAMDYAKFQAWCTAWASAVLRVLAPGGVLLAFGGTRTWHRLAVAIEDAGLEVCDTLMWLYGQGFPKSMAIDKAIDREAGAERIGGARIWQGGQRSGGIIHDSDGEITATRTIYDTPATPLAATWQGWGTALKPAWEPVLLCRKPRRATYAQTAAEHGSGAIWVDGARIAFEPVAAHRNTARNEVYGKFNEAYQPGDSGKHLNTAGRWPANLLLDEDAAAAIGEPARYFYTAKASRRERDAGLEGMALGTTCEHDGRMGQNNSPTRPDGSQRHSIAVRNSHPTVKPLALCRYLATLIRPPEAYLDRTRLLVPFAGSGSECIGAMQAGWRNVVGIEREAEYVEIARRRIAYWQEQEEPETLALPLVPA